MLIGFTDLIMFCLRQDIYISVQSRKKLKFKDDAKTRKLPTGTKSIDGHNHYRRAQPLSMNTTIIEDTAA